MYMSKSLDGMKFKKLTGKCPSCGVTVENRGKCPDCGAYFRQDGTFCFTGRDKAAKPKKEIVDNENKTQKNQSAPPARENTTERGFFDF